MRKIYWFFIALILFAVVTFIIYYNVAKIGITLRGHHQYVEYVFYAFCIILYIALIADPMISIMFKERYSVSEISSGNKANYRFCKQLYKNIIKQGNLKEEEINDLNEIYADKKIRRKRLNKKLYLVYNNTLKKNIDDYIMDTAKNTFYFTAMSQNGFVDLLVVLVNNFRMIKKIVQMCGFRPSFLRVMKLYVNVFSSSLIADGAQQINLTNILGASITGGLKIVVNSVANGTLNAFFMLRTGFLAKEYLFTEEIQTKKKELRNTAMMEAASVLPSIVTSVVTDPIRGLSKMLFKGNAKDTEPNQQEEDIIIDLNQKWHRKKGK